MPPAEVCSLAAEYQVSDQRLELPADGSKSRLACEPKGFDCITSTRAKAARCHNSASSRTFLTELNL
ncbi:MAG: hypothetical protein CMJ71_06235 [Planctomycetaceae bacterium]|nr:hypothetical protein [Planctomycetaceae bacterium]